MAKLALPIAVAALVCAGGSMWHLRTRGELPAPPRAGGTPIVVEIFSSEGCSSCPPADEYVANLDRDQPIDGVSVIALEFHVDYWDRLGWNDPFGSEQFTERQRDYTRALQTKLYTPEIIFQGRKVMEGGDEDKARDAMIAIAAEPRARVSVVRTGRGEVDVAIDDVPEAKGETTEAWLAVTESHLESKVTAGENNGRVLRHAPIVRDLRKLGAIDGGTYRGHGSVPLALSWKPAALRFVVFAATSGAKRIVGAGTCNALD